MLDPVNGPQVMSGRAGVRSGGTVDLDDDQGATGAPRNIMKGV